MMQVYHVIVYVKRRKLSEKICEEMRKMVIYHRYKEMSCDL